MWYRTSPPILLDHYENVGLVMNIDAQRSMSVSSSNIEKRMAEVFALGIVIPFLLYDIDIHVFISKRSSYNQTVRSTTYVFGHRCDDWGFAMARKAAVANSLKKKSTTASPRSWVPSTFLNQFYQGRVIHLIWHVKCFPPPQFEFGWPLPPICHKIVTDNR